VYRDGTTTVISEGVASAANDSGTVGGGVVTDFDNFFTQAALFPGEGQPAKVIPRLPDEYSSNVVRITESGMALVQSDSATGSTFYLYKNGTVTPLNLGTNQLGFLDVNNRGLIAGTVFGPNGARAFRFSPFSGVTTQLNPLPSEPESEGLGINSRGDVLGYSFKNGGIERIGVWRDKRSRRISSREPPTSPR
jgi:hypothetical protein